MGTYLFLFAATAAAFIVKGVTGFGNTLVVDSLYLFLLSSRATSAMDVVFSLPVNLYIVWRERGSVSLRRVLPIAVFTLAGLIPGALLLSSGNDRVLRIVCGAAIVAVALEMLFRRSLPQKAPNRAVLAVVAVLSGVLSGLFGIGALLAAYLSRSSKNQGQFRADMCLLFALQGVFRLAMYIATGVFTVKILVDAASLLPAVVCGTLAGLALYKRMSAKSASRAAVIFLIISGSVLVVQNVIALF